MGLAFRGGCFRHLILVRLPPQQAQAGSDDLTGVLVLAGGALGANERVQFSREGDVAGLICWHEVPLHEARGVVEDWSSSMMQDRWRQLKRA